MVPLPKQPVNPHVSPFIGRRMFRVHPQKYDANSFNNGFGEGRFHQIFDNVGNNIPTLYASNRINGALAETVFHDSFYNDIVYQRDLDNKYLSRISFQSNLQLIDLTGNYINRINITRTQLLESEKQYYHITARWAEALHDACPNAHGMKWVSRKFDTSISILIFGDRVKSTDIIDMNKSETLQKGDGYRHVQKAASQAGFTIVTS